jgi:hypothetical protein
MYREGDAGEGFGYGVSGKSTARGQNSILHVTRIKAANALVLLYQ